MQEIKNIIFDLGGVFLDLDFKQTELAFAGLGVGNFNEYYTLQTATPIFEQLETGKISPEIFFDEFRKIIQLPLSNEQIIHAWNAMLLNFPPERINWLKEIGRKYKVYLLSNTNQIHEEAFTKLFKEQIGNYNFDDLFIKAYYSHKLGLRKPSNEIFETVLKNENLVIAETIFIDDSDGNIQAANKIGLQTIHLPSPKTVLDLAL
jgi:HAD superfamily hydrolase (TIGR01509 family)